MSIHFSMQHNYWELINKKFHDIPNNDPFWKKAIEQLPLQKQNDADLKTQIIAFYKKMKKIFDKKQSATAQQVAMLKSEAEFAINRAVDLAVEKTDVLTRAIEDPALQELADELEAQEKEYDKSYTEITGLIIEQRQALTSDPITKLFAHCILVAHEKPGLSSFMQNRETPR